jgi:hypothetical protein
VAALIPGQDAPFSLGEARVALTWADVTNLGSVRLNAEAGSSGGAALVNFLNVSTEDLINGLTALADRLDASAGQGLMATKIPLVDKTLGEILEGYFVTGSTLSRIPTNATIHAIASQASRLRIRFAKCPLAS